MKIRLNPIVKKDLQVTARSMRLSWGLFAYEAVLLMAFLLTLLIIQEQASSIYGNSNIYSYLVSLFPVLAVTQVCIVALIVPILTASAISGEKERQTFDIMLTTSMSPLSIVLGKLISAVIKILFFVAAGLPIMALSFVVGGLGWSALFYFLLTILLLSVFSGSVGICCSAFCKRSISASILSFVLYFVIMAGTFLPLLPAAILGKSSMGESMLFLLFNPIVFFEEFFMQVMTGSSLLAGDGGIGTAFRQDEVGILTYYLARGKVWMFVSAGCILALSAGFLFLAAWRVNPMHESSGQKRRKKRTQ